MSFNMTHGMTQHVPDRFATGAHLPDAAPTRPGDSGSDFVLRTREQTLENWSPTTAASELRPQSCDLRAAISGLRSQDCDLRAAASGRKSRLSRSSLVFVLIVIAAALRRSTLALERFIRGGQTLLNDTLTDIREHR